MLSIAWSEEHKEVPREKPITGIFVGQTDVTLNELWTHKTTTKSGRI